MNLSKLWLTLVLCFLPFQRMIVKNIRTWNNELASFLAYIDEITILIFFMLALGVYYKDKKLFSGFNLVLLIPLMVFSLIGLVSGIVNGNSLFITSMGTIDYIKNFFVIFIYAAFFREFSELKKVFHVVLIVAVILGAVALIQETWMLIFKYILIKDVPDLLYVFKVWGEERLGIYRVRSLMHHPNMLGLYCLLIFTIYLHMIKRVNVVVALLMLTGVFVSVSRMIYTGFMLMTAVYIFKGRKWFMLVLIPFILYFYVMTSSGNLKMVEVLKQNYNEETSVSKDIGTVSYREYAQNKAMTIWKDYPLLGVGPGMFGGPISINKRSPVYDEYDASFIYRWFRSLDQFWPQLLAEAGIIGAMVFLALLGSLFFTLFILARRSRYDELKNLFEGLAIFMIVINVYLIGSGLNITSVLFTYFAFVGMGFGCESSCYKSCEEIG